MSPVDLRTSPLLTTSVAHEPGELAGALPLAAALDAVEASLPPEPRAGGGFRIAVDDAGRAVVEAADRPSLARLRSALKAGAPRSQQLGVQTVSESAATPWRAVLECFYGELWTTGQRLDVLQEAAEQGGNAYVFGPSADRRTGGAWREPYGEAEREEFLRFTSAARELGIRPIWRVSPAAPLEPEKALRFSDAEDLARLREVAQAALDMGFDAVLIAFDDIKSSLDDASREAFSESRYPLATAHARAINMVAEHLGSERVIACPTHYWSGPGSRYREVFGQDLAPGIPVCWTGPDVISERITATMTADVAAELGHPLWLWDNYPVNDWDVLPSAASRTRLHEQLDNLIAPRRMPLAPLREREGALLASVVGYGANAALLPRTSGPAVRTALDFAWSGEAYDPDRSWDAALRTLDADAEALDVLADAFGSLAASARTRPPALARACAAVLVEDDREGALARLRNVLDQHLDAIGRVRATAASDILAELRPWLYSLSDECVLAELAHQAISSTPHQTGRISRLLDVALARRNPIPTVCGAGRMLAEYARGLTAGGTPAVPQ